jgi:hypothetical protein
MVRNLARKGAHQGLVMKNSILFEFYARNLINLTAEPREKHQQGQIPVDKLARSSNREITL